MMFQYQKSLVGFLPLVLAAKFEHGFDTDQDLPGNMLKEEMRNKSDFDHPRICRKMVEELVWIHAIDKAQLDDHTRKPNLK